MGRARPDSTAHSTPAALAPAGSSQRAATCARVLRPAPHWSRRPQCCSGNRGFPIAVPPPAPSRTLPHPAGVRTAVAGASGSAPPRKGSATVGFGRRLRCTRGSERFARLSPARSGARARRAAFPSPSAAAPRAAPLGETLGPSFFPGWRISGGEEFRLGPYEHLGLPSPPLATPPPRGRARTDTHSHLQARVREPRVAESPAPLSRAHSFGRRYSHRLPAATGRPLSAAAAAEAADGTVAAARPLLAAPCPGQSPGEAEEDTETRRSRARRPAPRDGLSPLPVSRPQVSSSGARSIPGASGVGAGLPQPRPRQGAGVQAWGGEGRGGGRWLEPEVRLVGWVFGSVGAWATPPSLSSPSPSASSVTFMSPGVSGAPDSCSPLSPLRAASVGSELRTRRAPPTSRAPWTAHPASHRPRNRTRDCVLLPPPSRCPLLSRLPPSCPASLVLPALADSALVRARNFPPC